MLTLGRVRTTLFRNVKAKTMGGVQLEAADLPFEVIVAGLNGSSIQIDSLIDIVHQRACEVLPFIYFIYEHFIVFYMITLRNLLYCN